MAETRICLRCSRALELHEVKLHIDVVASVDLPPELEPLGRAFLVACVLCAPAVALDLAAWTRKQARLGENDLVMA